MTLGQLACGLSLLIAQVTRGTHAELAIGVGDAVWVQVKAVALMLYLSQATPGAATALRFGQYLNLDKVQAWMRKFGREQYGEPMYYDAATTAKNLAR